MTYLARTYHYFLILCLALALVIPSARAQVPAATPIITPASETITPPDVVAPVPMITPPTAINGMASTATTPTMTYAQQPVPKVTAATKTPNRSSAKGTIVLPSLFYTKEERDAIDRAKMQYAGGAPEETEEDLIEQLEGIKATSKKTVEEPLETVYPQFYLVSLMYHNAQDWAVWVRDLGGITKYDSEKAQDEYATLKVVQIAPENVVLEWAPRNWTNVTRAYKPGTDSVAVNPNRKLVRFTLRVNQTFESGEMKIVEGVVKPTTVVQVTPTAPALGPDGKPVGGSPPPPSNAQPTTEPTSEQTENTSPVEPAPLEQAPVDSESSAAPEAEPTENTLPASEADDRNGILDPATPPPAQPQ